MNTDINNIELTAEDRLAMVEAWEYGTPWYEADKAYWEAKVAEAQM